MAKGQKRSSREPRKPKQPTPTAPIPVRNVLGMSPRKA